ncbi:hypothetical protein CONPUDRAFT_166019, partial [Coniophora puteana RWD-64-598 SS2]
MNMTYTCTLWAARASILLSILRICPFVGLAHVLYASLSFFVISWTVSLVTKCAICARDRTWEHHAPVLCPLGAPTAIIELTAGVVSDTVLISAPIYMLRGIRLPHRTKRLILVTFSMAVCNSFASLAHILHLLPPVTPNITLSAPITASIQTSVTLIVANLLVVVTFVNRVIFKRRSDDTEMSVHS